MKKIVTVVTVLLVVFIGTLWGVTYIKEHNPIQQSTFPTNTQIPVTTSEKDIANEQVGIPQTLQIEKLNINAPVEQVGLDASGKMDVPKSADNVGWYSLGYKPGEKGNAVFAGHLDKVDGSPAIFQNLESLTQGDAISVVDSKGKTHVFSVEKIIKYPYNDFPIQEVFGSSSEPRLNLITCVGNWDFGSRNYSHRLVVYTRMNY